MGMRALAIAVVLIACGCTSKQIDRSPTEPEPRPDPAPASVYFGSADLPDDPTALRYCNAGIPDTLDPALATSTVAAPLVQLMFGGLAEPPRELDGEPNPGLAIGWEWSLDYKSLTVSLRDARWSNGREVTSADFVHHIVRILHPSSNSRLVGGLTWWMVNAELYHQRRALTLTRDAPPFRRGEVVEAIAALPPVVNLRSASKPASLRPWPRADAAPHHALAARAAVEIVDVEGDWAYVHHGPAGGGTYGWLRSAELDIQPHATTRLAVRPLDRSDGRRGEVAGAALLSLPDALGVRAPDPVTLVLEAARPTPELVWELSSNAFRPAPIESVSRSPDRWTDPAMGILVTSGAFTLKEAKPDRMVFSRSETFINRAQVKSASIVSINDRDQRRAVDRYRAGECDVVATNNIPVELNAELASYPDFKSLPHLGIYYYAINTEKLANPSLRRALSAALDRRAMVSSMAAPGIRTAALVPGAPADPGCGGPLALNVLGGRCYAPSSGADFDPVKARKLLERARAEMGADFPDKVELAINAGVGDHEKLAAVLIAQWREHLGLEVSLERLEWKRYLRGLAAGDFEVARLGWIASAPEPAQFLITLRCPGGELGAYNRARFCDAEFDRLFDAATAETDLDKRYQLFRQADARAMSLQPVIPIYVYTQRHLRKPYVRGLVYRINGEIALWRGYNDPSWRSQ